MTDVGPVSPPTLIPGEPGGKAIEPGFPSVLDPSPMRGSRRARRHRSRRAGRLALARWLSRPDNPLSTRVIVNRIWQYHFGRGLPARPATSGDWATRPAIPSCSTGWRRSSCEQGLRLKPLHRLILTSAAYRQSASRSPRDSPRPRGWIPKTGCSGSERVRRLDAEEIRDAMLASSGELEQVDRRTERPGNQTRRTIDTRVIRNSPDELLDAFDAPDGNRHHSPPQHDDDRPTGACSDQRRVGASPGRKLSPTRLEQAKPASSGHTGRVVMAFRLAVGRSPLPDEIAEAVTLSGPAGAIRWAAAPHRADAAADHAALVDFCHVLFNSNEFLYVD